MSEKLNTSRLSLMLRLYAASENIDYIQLSREIGISASTLNFILKGADKDWHKDTITKIVAWIIVKEQPQNHSKKGEEL